VHLAPNDAAATAALRLGAPIAVATEPVVAPGFRPAARGEQAAAREKFGLPQGERLALVVSGSWGVGQVEETTRDVAASGAAHPVVVCGRNEALRDRMRGTGAALVFGWIDDMAALMRACDVVVQNAGGLTTLEALATRLPVLTYRCLPGHGRANARVLDEIGLVPWIADGPALARALTTAAGTALPRGDDPTRLLAWLAAPASRAKATAA
jgi:UDP-N-acetylglucosamine:LPS N-acetylglucosamine transferase